MDGCGAVGLGRAKDTEAPSAGVRVADNHPSGLCLFAKELSSVGGCLDKSAHDDPGKTRQMLALIDVGEVLIRGECVMLASGAQHRFFCGLNTELAFDNKNHFGPARRIRFADVALFRFKRPAQKLRFFIGWN